MVKYMANLLRLSSVLLSFIHVPVILSRNCVAFIDISVHCTVCMAIVNRDPIYKLRVNRQICSNVLQSNEVWRDIAVINSRRSVNDHFMTINFYVIPSNELSRFSRYATAGVHPVICHVLIIAPSKTSIIVHGHSGKKCHVNRKIYIIPFKCQEIITRHV